MVVTVCRSCFLLFFLCPLVLSHGCCDFYVTFAGERLHVLPQQKSVARTEGVMSDVHAMHSKATHLQYLASGATSVVRPLKTWPVYKYIRT